MWLRASVLLLMFVTAGHAEPCSTCSDGSVPVNGCRVIDPKPGTINGTFECEVGQLFLGWNECACRAYPTPPQGDCRICPDGQDLPDRSIVVPWSHDGNNLTCGILETSMGRANEEECKSLVQRYAAWCECPGIVRVCNLCPPGQRLVDAQKDLSDSDIFEFLCDQADLLFTKAREGECLDGVLEVNEQADREFGSISDVRDACGGCTTTGEPTTSPTLVPNYSTVSPTKSPTKSPTVFPTKAPTDSPTTSPTKVPTATPTKSPTKAPTLPPTKSPTKAPTVSPTTSPTQKPTPSPTAAPTDSPTKIPTRAPTFTAEPPAPTPSPVIPSAAPVPEPTLSPDTPTNAPVLPTMFPTFAPVSPTSATIAPFSSSPVVPTSSPVTNAPVAPTSAPVTASPVNPGQVSQGTPSNATDHQINELVPLRSFTTRIELKGPSDVDDFVLHHLLAEWLTRFFLERKIPEPKLAVFDVVILSRQDDDNSTAFGNATTYEASYDGVTVWVRKGHELLPDEAMVARNQVLIFGGDVGILLNDLQAVDDSTGLGEVVESVRLQFQVEPPSVAPSSSAPTAASNSTLEPTDSTELTNSTSMPTTLSNTTAPTLEPSSAPSVQQPTTSSTPRDEPTSSASTAAKKESLMILLCIVGTVIVISGVL